MARSAADGKLEFQMMLAGWPELLLMAGAMDQLSAAGANATHSPGHLGYALSPFNILNRFHNDHWLSFFCRQHMIRIHTSNIEENSVYK